jgi:hypothetical protein
MMPDNQIKRPGHGISLIVAMFIGGIFIASIYLHPVQHYQRAQCREALRLLGNAIQIYGGEHQGQLPRQLTLLSNELSNPAFLVCPGSGHKPGSYADAEIWKDYQMIDWFLVFGTNAVPGNYPIAYDRFMKNHGGEGANVFTVDGVVRWDLHAGGLKRFSIEHPDVHLILPE